MCVGGNGMGQCTLVQISSLLRINMLFQQYFVKYPNCIMKHAFAVVTPHLRISQEHSVRVYPDQNHLLVSEGTTIGTKCEIR